MKFDQRNQELVAMGKKPKVWGAAAVKAAEADQAALEELQAKQQNIKRAMRSSTLHKNAERAIFPIRADLSICVHNITPDSLANASSPGAIHRQVARNEKLRKDLEARSRMKIVDTMGSEGGTKVLKMAYRSTQLANEVHRFDDDSAARRKMLAKIARDEKRKAENMAEITSGLDAARDKRRAKKEALATVVVVVAPTGFWPRAKAVLQWFNPCAGPKPTNEEKYIEDFGAGALERDEEGNLIDEDGNIVEEVRNEIDFSEVMAKSKASTMKRARQRMELQYLATLQAAHDLNKPKTYYTSDDFVSACGDGFYWKAIEILEQVIPPKVQMKEGIYPVQVNDIGASMTTGFFECFMGALREDDKKRRAHAKRKKEKQLGEKAFAATTMPSESSNTFKIKWSNIVRALAADEYSTDEEEVTDEMLEKRDFNKLLKFLIDRGAKIDTIDESADSNGWTLLHHSAVLENKRRLTWCEEQGMPVDGIDPKGMTALMYCAGRGQVKMVLQLITMGASVDQQDESGWCALHHASLSGGSKLCKLLLVAGSDKLAVTKDGEMALDLAKRAPKSVSQKKIIELLLMYQPQRIPRDEYIRFAGQLVGIDVDASVNASVDLTRSFDESSVLTPFTTYSQDKPDGERS